MKRLFFWLKYLIYGMGYGCFYLVVMCIIWQATGNTELLEAVMADFTRQALGAMVVGIGFGSTSVVYQLDWPFWQKLAVHFGVGMAIFIPSAYLLGWVPPGLGVGGFISFILYAVAIFFLIWACFFLYYRWEAKQMNQQLKKMNQEQDGP